jgi:DNA-binding IclR family transcriptional regulator
MIFELGRPVRVTDASNVLSVSPSTAHRLLTTLESRGFVHQDPVTRAYLLGDAFVRLSRSLGRDAHLESAAETEIGDLAVRLRETVHVGLLRGAKASIIASAVGVEVPHIISRVGTSYPAHLAASGKVLLADLDLAALRSVFINETFATNRSYAITSWSSLVSALDDVRRKGYATSFQEVERGVNAVAVPIKGHSGFLYGSLTVSGPSYRLKRHKMWAYAKEMRGAAERVAKKMDALCHRSVSVCEVCSSKPRESLSFSAARKMAEKSAAPADDVRGTLLSNATTAENK